jgi:23S rRNA (uracil1939-C5)-methyltransferase
LEKEKKKVKSRNSKAFKLKVEKLVYGGKGLGRLNGKAVFVPDAAPGDLLLVEEVARKSGFSEARTLKILERGRSRVRPKCPYFGKCGGCDWQHIKYSEQVKAKRLIVEENLQRIGKIKKPNIDEVIPSPSPWHYRNRAQIKVKNGRVGFFAKASNNVVDISRCPILKEDICDIFGRLKKLLKRLPQEPSEFHVHSSTKGEITLKIVYSTKRIPEVRLPLEEVREILQVNLVGYGVYKKSGDYPERIDFVGRDFVYEIVGKFKFRVSADSFFQVNHYQVENLISRVARVAMEHQYMLAGDLYCGVGTFTIPIGRYVHRAFGVESNFWAVSDALYNKDINGLRNVQFFCRETEEALEIVEQFNPDLVVLDPPRSGLNEKIIRKVARLPRLKKIVYVSCNPATLARDIATFHRFGVNMERAKVIDMFPQTYHVETVAILRKVK